MLIEATSRLSDRPGPEPGGAASPVPWGTTPWRAAEFAAGAFIAGYGNDNTRASYKIDLKVWFAFLEELGVSDPVHEVGRSHVEVFLRREEQRDKAPATISRRLSTVHMFYEWLIDGETIDRNPTRKVRRPVVPKISTTPWLNGRELSNWIEAGCELGGYDAVTALILGFNGLRVSELTGSNIEDIHEQSYHHVLRIVGKGQKLADIPLPPRTLFTLEHVLDGRAEGPLVLTRNTTRDGKPHRASRESVARSVARIAAEARIKKHITPHGIRHSAVTALLQAGVPFRDVQLFARHENSTTTERYDRARENLEKHPAYLAAMYLAA